MDFTREPIIETIITPRDGCKLVVRSSKSVGQEEYFVDAVEVVSFGHALFFRSLERPKAFLVPISDYEVLEVREARMVLKNIGLDRSIKIGGGREGTMKAAREAEKVEAVQSEESPALTEVEEQRPAETAASVSESRPEVRLDKKRDRRRHYRKKRNGKEESAKEEGTETAIPPLEEGGKVNIQAPEEGLEQETGQIPSAPLASSLLSSLLQPPPTLISETISHYREKYKNAFFIPEEEQYKPHDKAQELLNEEDEFTPALQEPVYEPLEESPLAIFEEQPFQEATTEEAPLEEPVQPLTQEEPKASSKEEEILPFELTLELKLEQTKQDETLSAGAEESQQESPLEQTQEESESNLPYPAPEEERPQEGEALAEHVNEEESKPVNHMPSE